MARKVLIVDDDQIMVQALKKSFAAASDSFEVVTAKDGFDAVKTLETISVSLMVIDLIMPRMDGMTLLSHIQGKYPDVAVIFMSAMNSGELQKLAKASGVMAYLIKPFLADDLRNMIMTALDQEANGGIMHNVSPPVFLQLMEIDVKTCTIRLLEEKSGKGGILYFVDGELLDARVGEITGIDAAYEVFSWDAVTIFMRNECSPRQNNINSGLQPIIMKAVGLKDESDEGDFEAHTDCGEMSFTLNDLREKLQKVIGGSYHLGDVYQCEEAGNLTESLAKLGTISDFGDFKAGIVENDKENSKIILAGQQVVAMNMSSRAPKDKILEIIKEYNGNSLSGS